MAAPAQPSITEPPNTPAGGLQRRLLALVTGVLLVSGLISIAFVGDQGDETGVATLVAAARTVGAGAESISFESTSTFTIGAQIGGGYLVSGAVADDGRGRINMQFEGVPLPDQTFLSDGNLLFAEVPKENRSRVDGKQWVAAPMDRTDLGQFGDVTQLGLDSFLAGAGDDVTTVGRETIRGVETTHHRVRVDSQAVFQALLEAPTVGAPPGLAGVSGEMDLEVAPVDVWLDGEDRLRRIEVTVRIDAAPASSEIQLRHDVFDYGEPVTVALPDSNDTFLVDSVATLESLLQVAPSG